MKLLKLIKQHLSIAIPVTMILGIIAGIWLDAPFLKHAIIPITFIMIYPMMVALPVRKLANRGGGAVQAAAVVINFIVSPLLAYALGLFFFRHESYLRLALLLIGLIPTGGMTIAWTGMAQGNKLAAIKMTIIGLLLGALLVPLYTSFFLGAEVALPLAKIVKQILVVIVTPLILGVVTQHLLLQKYSEDFFQNTIKPQVSQISTAGVILMVFVAMFLRAKQILANPLEMVALIPVLLLFYTGLFLISTIAGRLFFKRADSVALVFGTAMRNLSIILALTMTLFPAEGASMALLATMAYIVQIQSGALYARFASKLIGESTI